MKWTLRTDGVERWTFRVRFHVPREMLGFLQKHADMTKAEADAFFRTRWQDLTDDWRQLVVAPDGEAFTASVDDLNSMEADGYAVYDGPAIVTSG